MAKSAPAPASPRPLLGRGDDTMLVTGEAVLIDLPPASVPQRIVSGLIDLITYLILLAAVVWFVYTQVPWVSDADTAAATLVSVVGCLVVAPMTVETVTRGRSLGKWIMRLRTVRDDAGPIVFRHAFVRALLGFVEIYAFSGVPALISSLCTARAKRMGDLAAGTYVVRLEPLRPIPAAPPMPPPLAGWATACDIAPLPDGLSVSVRQFLLRSATLSPPARAHLADLLMAQVAPLIAPPPPAGAPVGEVLAAVVAETRRREALRLAADQRVRTRLVVEDPLTATRPTPSPVHNQV